MIGSALLLFNLLLIVGLTPSTLHVARIFFYPFDVRTEYVFILIALCSTTGESYCSTTRQTGQACTGHGVTARCPFVPLVDASTYMPWNCCTNPLWHLCWARSFAHP